MTWQEALQQYYDTHDTMNGDNRAWLRGHVAMDATLISDMTRENILAKFSQHGELNHTLLLRTIIWQSLGLILSGKMEPLNSNVRSIYYELTDPIYSHNSLYKAIDVASPSYTSFLVELEEEEPDLKTDLLFDAGKSNEAKHKYIEKSSGKVFSEFVTRGIFTYSGPFAIQDAKANFRLLGEGWASIIFFVEKEGLFKKYCESYHEEFKVSAVASEGFPSFTTLEYFAEQLRAKKIKNVALAGLVDYDPAGYAIFDDYIKKFQSFGFGIKAQLLLTSIDLYTEKSLELYHDDLTHVHPSREKQTEAWFQKTGGIHGKRYGIHCNKATKSRVDAKFRKFYKEQVSRFALIGGEASDG